MCPIKNVAVCGKNKWQVQFTHQLSIISKHLQYINTTTVQYVLALQYIQGFCQSMQLHHCTENWRYIAQCIIMNDLHIPWDYGCCLQQDRRCFFKTCW
jgi:mRNA-degrading endonuclease YafQ of YafQ-DinJ toxin-antitoxin module